ncbi:MAG: hypothetical protein ABI415_09595 [Flavitalea sp.]
MLNEKETHFVKAWEASREREGKLIFQLLKGIPMGLAFALPIMVILFTGRYWFIRADMVANSQMSFGVLIFAVLGITIFVAVFFKKHQWEMKEQQYRELLNRANQP